jgi:hypothetical protein
MLLLNFYIIYLLSFYVYELRSMKCGYIYYVTHTYYLVANRYFIGIRLVMNGFSQKMPSTQLPCRLLWLVLTEECCSAGYLYWKTYQNLFLLLMLPPYPNS